MKLDREYELPSATTAATRRRPDTSRLLLGLLLLLSLAVVATRHPLQPAQRAPPPARTRIAWTACPDSPGVECGSLLVPLDHADANSTAQIELALARVRAPARAARRRTGAGAAPALSLVINPGGPGGSGTATVRRGGAALLQLAGGGFDVVGFDPRGVGASQSVRCFESAFAHAEFDAVEAAIGPLDARFAKTQEAKAASCGKWSPALLPFLSTASVARDMDLIRQALGEDVLNYWGFSYGSFLGTVYSQMFPDRVGRFVIDGVMDATTYINSFAEFTLNNLIDTDDIFKGFVQECESAGPTRCALASTAMQSKSSVEKVFRKLLKDLKKDALVVVDGVSFPTVISADTVLAWLFRAYYAPSSWQVIAEAFAGLVEGDASQLVKLMNQSPDAAPTCPLLDESGSVGFVSVVCVDTVGNDMSIDKWKKYAAKNKEISEWFGESWTMQALTCKYWPAEASERYTGPWNKKLKNKVLIIGNRYDPVTPLRSAQIVEKVMEGNGVLLTREGYGHCSTSMVSFCALKHIREYFVNGTLPNKGTVCDTDFDVFPDKMVEAMMDSDTLKVVQDVKLVQELIIKSQPKF